MRKSFYNIYTDTLDENEALSLCSETLKGNKCKSLFFINAHCFNVAQKNIEYRNALLNSDFVLNDGIGIKIAGILARIKFKENLNGTDLIPKIIELSAKQKKKIYILGSKKEIIVKTKENLENLVSNIEIIGVHDGYFSDSDIPEIIKDINNTKADILIIGMGVPRQEIWIDKYKSQLNTVKLCIAGGAIIDFISGEIKRAPKWIRNINMEWAYRLYIEPGRMWKRYIIGNNLFFFYILLYKLGLKASIKQNTIDHI